MRGAPERLLDDMRSRAVAGREEHYGLGGCRSQLLDAGEHIDAAVARRRQLAANSRHRPDDDELTGGDHVAVMHEPLLVEGGFGRGRVGERGVDFAVANRVEHGQRGPRHHLHGDAGIGAERLLEIARQARLDQGPVGTEAQRRQAAPSATWPCTCGAAG